MVEYRFIEPIDVLYLRGNKLFGDPGSHGEALMPPWPSVVAGALRSRMLVDAGADLDAFSRSQPDYGKEVLRTCLGTPRDPGRFRMNRYFLARKINGKIEPCFPLPADILVQTESSVGYLRPVSIPEGVHCGWPLSMLPVFRTEKQEKPKTGFWLNGAGLGVYLNGSSLSKTHLISTRDLWGIDSRLGIALDPSSRTAEEGRIYTTDTVAMCRNAGFLAGVEGADGLLPEKGLVRFGGDGRGATVEPCNPLIPEPPWRQIDREKRFRIVLATPGLFPNDWRLPGVDDTGIWHGPDGLRARLVAAAVPRAQVVSGCGIWRRTWRKEAPSRPSARRRSALFTGFKTLKGGWTAFKD